MLGRASIKRAPKIIRVFPCTRTTFRHVRNCYPSTGANPSREKTSWEKSWLAAPSDRGNDDCRRMRLVSHCAAMSTAPRPLVIEVKSPDRPGTLLCSRACRTRTGKARVAPARPLPFPCCSPPTAAVTAAVVVKRSLNRKTTTVGLPSRPLNRQRKVPCSTINSAPITGRGHGTSVANLLFSLPLNILGHCISVGRAHDYG